MSRQTGILASSISLLFLLEDNDKKSTVFREKDQGDRSLCPVESVNIHGYNGIDSGPSLTPIGGSPVPVFFFIFICIVVLCRFSKGWIKNERS